MINIGVVPLIPWYVMTSTMVTNIVTAAEISPPIDPPSNVLVQQRSQEMIDRLQLTSEQVEQLVAIEARYQDQVIELTGTVALHDLELTRLLSGDATPEEVRQQQNELTVLNQQLAELMFNQALEIRSVLTPAQRQQIVEMHGSRIRFREPPSP